MSALDGIQLFVWIAEDILDELRRGKGSCAASHRTMMGHTTSVYERGRLAGYASPTLHH